MKNRFLDALLNSIYGFLPWRLLSSPVMFVTEIAFIISVFAAIFPAQFGIPYTPVYLDFYVSVALMLFLTILFSNLSSSLSEGKKQGNHRIPEEPQEGGNRKTSY